MGKRTAQKRRAGGSTAANAQRGVPLIVATTITRPDLLILLALGAITFGIYAQVIGHQFITLDDPTYIRENPMVNRGVTLDGTHLGVHHVLRGKLASAHVDRAHDRQPILRHECRRAFAR